LTSVQVAAKMNFIRLYILFPLVYSILTACTNPEGTLELKGKVVDDFTKKGIPFREVIIEGLVRIDSNVVHTLAGQFSTDSSGNFEYILTKIKNSRYYDFSFVGDSEYVYKVRTLGINELSRNAKFLEFGLDKLVNLTIIINRKSKSPAIDTLSLLWESNGINGWKIFSYRINNYGKSKKSFDLAPNSGLTWIGGEVNTTINAKVFANKKTILSWDLYRYGRRKSFTDTIRCKRELSNYVYFTY
jgi:hypothetical protein